MRFGRRMGPSPTSTLRQATPCAGCLVREACSVTVALFLPIPVPPGTAQRCVLAPVARLGARSSPLISGKRPNEDATEALAVVAVNHMICSKVWVLRHRRSGRDAAYGLAPWHTTRPAARSPAAPPWSPARPAASAPPSPAGWPPTARTCWPSTWTRQARRRWRRDVPGGEPVACDLVGPRRGRRAARRGGRPGQQRRRAARRAGARSSTRERFALIQRLMLEAPFRLARRAAARHVRPRLGPVVHVSSRARPPRLAVQVGLRHGQARPGGALQGDRPGGRAARASPATRSAPATCARRWSRGRSPTRRAQHGIDEDEVLEKSCCARTPVKRLVEPDEVADLVGLPLRSRHRLGHRQLATMDGGWTAA